MSSLECIVHAAAPCPVPVKEAMIEWLGPIILEYYAATEAHGATLVNSEDWMPHKGTVGRPVLGEIVILDEENKQCPVGTSGTVWFKGATSFEYFNAPEKTAESRIDTEDGTMSTVGDVGLRRRGGLPVPHRPQDVHDHLRRREHLPAGDREPPHHAPEGDGRRGVRRPERGSRRRGEGRRAVGRRRRARPRARDASSSRSAASNLAHFKAPRSIDFEDELPRLPTGKLYKRLLRDRYWQDRDTRIV